MTATQFVEYNGDGFWAYDVALGVFLKHLIDAAEASPDASAPWLSEAVYGWQTAACISDFGLTLGRDWSSAELESFVSLAHGACAALAARDAIPAAEIASWPLLNELRIDPRGATEVATAPVVELGRAVIALVSGRLDAPPDGKAWFYGAPTGRDTIGHRRGAG
jgi:hypothetical protein